MRPRFLVPMAAILVWMTFSIVAILLGRSVAWAVGIAVLAAIAVVAILTAALLPDTHTGGRR